MTSIVPKHVGYIVDGNRRWAKERGLSTFDGHVAGYDIFYDIIAATFNAGAEYISAYIFSTENWKRNEDEVDKLMSLILKALSTKISIFTKNNIKLLFLGSRENLSASVIKAINKAEEKTANNSDGTMVLCFNYGGHQEIVDAVKKIVQSGCDVDSIDEALIEKNLYSPEIPPVDLIVRTSGEQRISNFMLWRAAYSEFIFLEKYWPDMTKEDVAAIMEEFSSRSRRFGG